MYIGLYTVYACLGQRGSRGRPQGVRRHTLRLGTRVVGSLSRSPRHSRTVSDEDAPVLPIGARRDPRYGKLDARSAFVTVLPPLRYVPLVVEDSEGVPSFALRA